VQFDDNWPIAENICEESIMQWNNVSAAESLRGIEEIRACLKKQMRNGWISNTAIISAGKFWSYDNRTSSSLSLFGMLCVLNKHFGKISLNDLNRRKI